MNITIYTGVLRTALLVFVLYDFPLAALSQTREEQPERANLFKIYKADTKVEFRKSWEGHSVAVSVENVADDPQNHSIQQTVRKGSDVNFTLIDGAERFGIDLRTRLSKTEVSWDGVKVPLANFPNNQSLPGSDRQVQFQQSQGKHQVRLVLEVTPDSNDLHNIERRRVNGVENVLVDGKQVWYDPASPIKWKLAQVQAWWDDKPVELRDFPPNHFYNFALHDYDLGFPDVSSDAERKLENGIGIYPSTDGTSVYIGMARRDPTTRKLAYAVLTIQNDGQCDVFPPSFQDFREDIGQDVKVLEGFSEKFVEAHPENPKQGK